MPAKAFDPAARGFDTAARGLDTAARGLDTAAHDLGGPARLSVQSAFPSPATPYFIVAALQIQLSGSCLQRKVAESRALTRLRRDAPPANPFSSPSQTQNPELNP